MIKKLYVFLLVLISLPSYGEELSIKPTEVISAMYKEYAWYPMMKVSALKLKPLHLSDRDSLESYFTKKLATLIVNNQSCVSDELVEGCKYSGNIIFPERALKVSNLVIYSESDELVMVKYVNPITTENVIIGYEMLKVNNRWLVEDVRYVNGDSLSVMLEDK